MEALLITALITLGTIYIVVVGKVEKAIKTQSGFVGPYIYEKRRILLPHEGEVTIITKRRCETK